VLTVALTVKNAPFKVTLEARAWAYNNDEWDSRVSLKIGIEFFCLFV
jgi:hypothetical protein